MKLGNIAHVGSNQRRAQDGSHPVGTSATPMVIPISRVSYFPAQSYPWGTLAYETMHVIWSPDGAPIPGSSGTVNQPGVWGRVVPAGNPSPAHR